MLYGLPPSDDIEFLKGKIIESISPFVKKVVDVVPCMHKSNTEDDFFDGKYNGNWRIKVVPRDEYYIPNFVVIGKDVMGRIVYTKMAGSRMEMCTECYRTGHFRVDCPGSRDWGEYVDEFNKAWESLMVNNDVNEEDAIVNTEEDSRLISIVREKMSENEDLLNTIHEQDEKLAKVADIHKEIELRDNQIKKLEGHISKFQKRSCRLEEES